MLPTLDTPASDVLVPDVPDVPNAPAPASPAPDALPPEPAIPHASPLDESTVAVASVQTPQDETVEAAAVVPAMSPAACSAQLKQLFPALFTGVAKPLKLRIQADIQIRAPGLFTKQLLSVVLRRYTGSHSYLVALTQATHRFDLDGAPAGELSAEHKQAAMDELTLRRATQRDAQRESQRDTQRKLQHDQRQEIQEQQERLALEEQKRRNRATLLHDFENTTLTPANFSALKGITLEAMEGYLATARQEAQARRAGQVEVSREVPGEATRQRAPEPRGERPRPDGRSGGRGGLPARGPRR
jgi:ProP effector